MFRAQLENALQDIMAVASDIRDPQPLNTKVPGAPQQLVPRTKEQILYRRSTAYANVLACAARTLNNFLRDGPTQDELDTIAALRRGEARVFSEVPRRDDVDLLPPGAMDSIILHGIDPAEVKPRRRVRTLESDIREDR